MTTARFHATVDARDMHRVLTFGDVHGCLEVLNAALIAHGYDPEAGDVAIGLGDWMDRGPAGLAEMNAFLDAHPEIRWVRGNHDDMLLRACSEGEGQHGAAENLYLNGGRWILDHMDETTGLPNVEAGALAYRLNAAPVAMTVLTPGNRRIGLVHAAVPADSWTSMVAALEGSDDEAGRMAWNCLWDRKAAYQAIGEAERGQSCDDWIVPGIDRVFYGHTPIKRPVRHGNQTWIDTAAFASGILTVIDLDHD